jgi:hypothetical protein
MSFRGKNIKRIEGGNVKEKVRKGKEKEEMASKRAIKNSK